MIWENNILLIYYRNPALSSFICEKRARARKRMRASGIRLAEKRNRARHPESSSEEPKDRGQYTVVMGRKKRPDYFFFGFAAGFFAGAGAGFATGFASAFFAGAGAGFAAGFASAFFAGTGFFSAFFSAAGATLFFAGSTDFNADAPFLVRCCKSVLQELNRARKPSLVMGTVMRRKTSCS